MNILEKIKQLINFIIIAIHPLFRRIVQYWLNVISTNVDFGPDVKIGRHTYGLNYKTISLVNSFELTKVTIGNFCSFAPGVAILANVNHSTVLPSTYPFRTLMFPSTKKGKFASGFNSDAVSKGGVDIGHDVWIGQNAIILSGVSIGTGVVIGAGSVVTKSLPPYAIAVGNPAKVIRIRFPPEIVEKLLQSEWWHLSDEKIIELETSLYDENIEIFINQIALLKNEK